MFVKVDKHLIPIGRPITANESSFRAMILNMKGALSDYDKTQLMSRFATNTDYYKERIKELKDVCNNHEEGRKIGVDYVKALVERNEKLSNDYNVIALDNENLIKENRQLKFNLQQAECNIHNLKDDYEFKLKAKDNEIEKLVKELEDERESSMRAIKYWGDVVKWCTKPTKLSDGLPEPIFRAAKKEDFEKPDPRLDNLPYVQTFGRQYGKSSLARHTALKHIVDNPKVVQDEHFLNYLKSLTK